MANEREPVERVRIIGYTWSPRSHEVRDFLARSRIPYKWLDYESNADARRRAEELGATAGRGLPLLLFGDGSHLADPSDEELAEHLGLSTEPEAPSYDLIIVGAGPAGMAAQREAYRSHRLIAIRCSRTYENPSCTWMAFPTASISAAVSRPILLTSRCLLAVVSWSAIAFRCSPSSSTYASLG